MTVANFVHPTSANIRRNGNESTFRRYLATQKEKKGLNRHKHKHKLANKHKQLTAHMIHIAYDWQQAQELSSQLPAAHSTYTYTCHIEAKNALNFLHNHITKVASSHFIIHIKCHVLTLTFHNAHLRTRVLLNLQKNRHKSVLKYITYQT